MALPLAFAFFLPAVPAGAFNQPPVNLGATTFLDGGPAVPGHYLLEYFRFIDGTHAKDKDGRTISGGASFTATVALNQYVYVSPVSVLGGNLGLDLLVPIVSADVKGGFGPAPLTANTGGLGDLVVGPLLQWNGTTLLGKPFFQRFELTAILPTGKYDKNFSVNPGSNLFTFNPYYSFTWLFAQGWETSWRVLYAWHAENGAMLVQPGQILYANIALSKEVRPKLRLGVSGYALQQLTEDRVAGAAAVDSKERVFAAGPGLVYAPQGFLLMLSPHFEFGARNRFQGTRTTLQLLHKF